MKRSAILATAALSFAAFVGIIVLLSAKQIVSVPMAKLMLVALFGLYVGFGILLLVYRLIMKLQ